MTDKKYFRAAFLLCVLLLLLVLPAQAVGFSLSVNPYGGERDSIDTIRCQLSSQAGKSGRQQYMLYLPADCDTEQLTVYYEGASAVSVDGTPLTGGEATACFSEVNREYTLRVDSRSYPLVVLQSENLPAMYLSTETGSLSALHKGAANYSESGHMRIYENGEQTADAKMKSIKLRGNWSRRYAKKPYTITLYDKVSLFGMEEAKKWVLVANWLDYTLLRNSLAQTLAKAYGLAYSPDFQSVDLYINGEYRGNYQLFEKIELGENRIAAPNLDNANKRANLGADIKGGEFPAGASASHEKNDYRRWIELPNEPEDISGAYLLELEISKRLTHAPCAFVTKQGQPVTLKSPKYASEGEVNYIADLFSDAHDALVSPDGYNEMGKHYSEYFDLDSLAKMYILQEYTMNTDACQTSAFFLKLPGDDKLYAVAPWDFDHSLFSETINTRYGVNLSRPYGWYAAISTIADGNTFSNHSLPTLLHSAMGHEDFRDLVAELWEELAPLTENAIEEQLTHLVADNQASAVMDAYRWGISYLHCADEAYEKMQGLFAVKPEEYSAQADAYLRVVEHMADQCRIRVEELNVGLSEESALVFFSGRQGEAYTLVEPMQKLGSELSVPKYSYKGTRIYRWNTSPDLSGTAYNFEDTMPLTERTMLLYPG